VTVVLIDAANLSEAQDGLFLQASFRVDERSELLREVDGLVDCNLSCLLLVSFHDVCETLHVSMILLEVVYIDVKGVGILGQFWEKFVQLLDTARAEHFIQKIHFVTKLVRDFEEAFWQLSDIDQGNF